MRKFISSSVVLAALAVTGAAVMPAQAQDRPRLPPEAVQPQLPPGVSDRLRDRLRPPTPCRVDPAITRVTLRKNGAPNRVQVAIEVVNRGPGTWSSSRGQGVASWEVRNGSTGRVQSGSDVLATSARAGGRLLSRTSPVYSDAFDTFEFSGSVTVRLAYDPDIAIDGNTCNDDTNMSNNQVTISPAQISAFMASRNAVQVFNF